MSSRTSSHPALEVFLTTVIAPPVIHPRQHTTLADATSFTGALSLLTALEAVWHSSFKHRVWSQAKLTIILFRKFWD